MSVGSLAERLVNTWQTTPAALRERPGDSNDAAIARLVRILCAETASRLSEMVELGIFTEGHGVPLRPIECEGLQKSIPVLGTLEKGEKEGQVIVGLNILTLGDNGGWPSTGFDMSEKAALHAKEVLDALVIEELPGLKIRCETQYSGDSRKSIGLTLSLPLQFQTPEKPAK